MKSFKVFSAICLFALLSLVSGGVWGQVVAWDFATNTSPSINLPGGTASVSFNTNGAIGTSGCNGNGYSSNNWNVNEYLQIILSTTGYSITTVSFNARSSNTGPWNFKFQYSSTGVSGPFSDLGFSFQSTNSTTCGTYNADFSSINSLDNNPNTVIRIVFTGGKADGSTSTGDAVSTGTFRVDDILVNGLSNSGPLPEPTNQASALSLGAVTTSTLPLSWSAAATGTQAPDGYLLLLNTGQINDPIDGADPGTGSLAINLGNASYKTGSTSATLTAAEAGTMYNVKLYSYTNGGNNINFNTTSPLTGNFATKPNPVTGLSCSVSGTSQISLNWLAAFNYNSTNHSTLVFAKSGSAITFSSGTLSPSSYTANSVFSSGTPYQEDGSAFCVYKGDGTEVTVTGLNPNTTYHFLVFVAVDALNLNNTSSYSSSLTSNAITDNLSVPISNSPTNIGCNFFTANWSSVNGATSYLIDVYPSSDLASDLIFSEYIEGSSNNKYIEIFNGTISTIDLSDYQLQTFINGASIASSITSLTGSLAPGAVVVYKNSQATVFQGTAINNASLNYNGNDAIALYKVSTSSFVDIIGKIGEDPGSAWSSGTLSTLDKTLVRKATIRQGVSVNPTTGFQTLTTEWDVYNTNDVTNLGSHAYTLNYVTGFQNLSVNSTNQSVTNLTPGVSYVYRVKASNAQGTSAFSNQVFTSLTTVGTWIGSSQGNWNDNNNWCGGIPNSNMNAIIPAGNSVELNNSNAVSLSNLLLSGTLTIPGNKQLTLTGTLTNNGTLTLENGATLVQGASSNYSGSGTVQVKQSITGGNNGNSPNGRFWYLGSPVAGGLSSILDAAGANVVKYWDETGAAWVEITDNTSALTVGRGHYLRSYTPGNQTLTFTGGALNNGTYTLPLTANGANFNGFNLVSNPYPSYLKWDDVAKTNVGTTIWYRTSNGANNMVFDTYNSNGNVGTSNNGAGTVSQFIPPMQAFWVKVEGNTSGSIVLENIDRSHHVSGMQGMHSLLDKQMFANINLIKDTLRDQAIVYSSYTTADVFDAYDSEKMFQANIPQLYSKINDKKVVINAKNFMQRNEKTPLFMNIPSAGSYTMQLGEFNSSFGSIWLEDLSNGQLQNLLINDTYTFETEAGQDLARFVLHFGYPEQIYGTDVFESVEENFDSPVNWNDISVVAADDKVIDLTASLNEIDAKQTKIVSVFDMTGRQIMTGTFENGNNQIQVPAANAVYMVHVSVGSAHKVFKVLIQQ